MTVTSAVVALPVRRESPSFGLRRIGANRTLALVGSLLIALNVPEAGFAQTAAPQPVQAQAAPAAAGQSAPVFKMEELDQIVAPIALYQDDLLMQVLMASSYPLEIVQAQRWVADPKNAALKGDQLADALEDQRWDPSVKSLLPFPQVLQMMSDQLDWTQRLGDAVLAQQKDVMDAVQRLRQRAQANGSLKSNEQQTVSVQAASTQPAHQLGSGQAVQTEQTEQTAQMGGGGQQTIVIQPADPQTVYVPAYNPNTVYGTWPYPSYPPAYYPPPPAYYPGYYAGAALATGLTFAAGVAVTGALWGWGSANWGGGSININNNVYNNINRNNISAGRTSNFSGNSWRHDPGHRGGVAYRDPGTRQQFRNASAAGAGSRQNFRGFDNSARTGAQGANRLNAQAANRTGGQAASRAGAQAGNRAGGQFGNRAGAQSGNFAGAGGARQGGAATNARSASQARASPGTFGGMGSGAQARAQSARGMASRGSAMQPRAASAGGGFRGGGGGGGGSRGGGGGGRR
jgi:hypothetical protein